ncbi:MalM family protein [Vibrio variabilis]|uniref:MalM family protein n=1 Tax=Vibrio variabilis TaxID=990271 RepID=UPI000DD6D00F|nr:MalM family protein [Vibrio variabilis]
MLRQTILAIALATTFGCAKQDQIVPSGDDVLGYEQLASAQGCCQSLANLNYQHVTEPGSLDVLLTPQSAKVALKTGRSFAQGIKLPNALGNIDLTVYSVIDKQVLVPTVLILDSNYQVIDVIDDKVIQHRESSLLYKSGFIGEYSVPNRYPDGSAPSYLVIVTTDKAMATSSEPMPPSEFALQSGQVSASDPFYSTNEIPHAAIGLVTLELDYQPTGPRLETEAQQQERQQVAEKYVEVEPGDALTAEKEQAFNAAIERAVEKGQFEKALRLSKEAEALGSQSAEKAFVDAMKKY